MWMCNMSASPVSTLPLCTLKSIPPHGSPGKARLANPTSSYSSSFVCQTCYQQPCEEAQALELMPVFSAGFLQNLLKCVASSTLCTTWF